MPYFSFLYFEDNYRNYSFDILDIERYIEFYDTLLGINNKIDKLLYSEIIFNFHKDVRGAKTKYVLEALANSIFLMNHYPDSKVVKIIKNLIFEDIDNFAQYGNFVKADDIKVGEYVVKCVSNEYHDFLNSFNDIDDNYEKFLNYRSNSIQFIIEENETNNIIGLINFEPLNNQVSIAEDEYSDEFEISYFIKTEYRKKGIAYNAIKSLIDAFFNNKVRRIYVGMYTDKYKIENLKINRYKEKSLDVCRLVITCAENNVASNKLAQKLGFTCLFNKDGNNSYCLINPKYKKDLKY